MVTFKTMNRYEKFHTWHDSEPGMSKPYSAKVFKQKSRKRKEARRSRRNNR